MSEASTELSSREALISASSDKQTGDKRETARGSRCAGRSFEKSDKESGCHELWVNLGGMDQQGHASPAHIPQLSAHFNATHWGHMRQALEQTHSKRHVSGIGSLWELFLPLAVCCTKCTDETANHPERACLCGADAEQQAVLCLCVGIGCGLHFCCSAFRQQGSEATNKRQRAYVEALNTAVRGCVMERNVCALESVRMVYVTPAQSCKLLDGEQPGTEADGEACRDQHGNSVWPPPGVNLVFDLRLAGALRSKERCEVARQRTRPSERGE